MPKLRDYIAGLTSSALDDDADELLIRDDSANASKRLTRATLDARYVNVAGDTMTGTLGVSAPTAQGHAASVETYDPATGRIVVAGREIGDTGWRDVSGLLINGWTATELELRRSGDLCQLVAYGLDGSSKTDDEFLDDTAVMMFDPPNVATGLYWPDSLSSAVIYMRSALWRCNATGPVYLTPSWLTSAAWGSSLPGTQVTAPAAL